MKVAYTKFINAARQQAGGRNAAAAVVGRDADTSQRSGRAAGADAKVNYEFIPDAAEILEELVPAAFKVRLFKCFLDAAVSEQIARRVAMKAATENAGDLIKDITPRVQPHAPGEHHEGDFGTHRRFRGAEMTPLRRALRILSVAGVVAFLMVRTERIEANGEKTERFTVGLWFSPWVIDERVEGPGAQFRFRRGVTFLSWSWLCLVPVVVYTHRAARGDGREHREQTGTPQADVREPG